MCSLINKQLLLTAYAYLFIMEQQKARQGSEALAASEPLLGGISAKASQPPILPICGKNHEKGICRSEEPYQFEAQTCGGRHKGYDSITFAEAEAELSQRQFRQKTGANLKAKTTSWIKQLLPKNIVSLGDNRCAVSVSENGEIQSVHKGVTEGNKTYLLCKKEQMKQAQQQTGPKYQMDAPEGGSILATDIEARREKALTHLLQKNADLQAGPYTGGQILTDQEKKRMTTQQPNPFEESTCLKLDVFSGFRSPLPKSYKGLMLASFNAWVQELRSKLIDTASGGWGGRFDKELFADGKTKYTWDKSKLLRVFDDTKFVSLELKKVGTSKAPGTRDGIVITVRENVDANGWKTLDKTTEMQLLQETERGIRSVENVYTRDRGNWTRTTAYFKVDIRNVSEGSVGFWEQTQSFHADYRNLQM